MYAIYAGCTVIITFIKGGMIGALYNKEHYEGEDIEEHTIQFCLLIITITIIWETEHIG